MSTGRRLAKRSIIGTRVCAQGPDGLWYSGVIQDVRTPPSKNQQTENNNCINLTSETRYTVRFDFKTVQMQMQSSETINKGNSTQVITTVQKQIDNTHHHQQQQQPQSQEDINMMETDQNYEQQQQQQQQIIVSHHQQPQHQHHIHHGQHVNLLLNPIQTIRRNALVKEFRESELIGPGFRSIMGVQLLPGQKVFLTYNGRETSGDVISHDIQKDDVIVRITAIGLEEPIELRKRLEEVRLLESRRSARLADQDRDTDFARLADMAGDRRRTSHNIDVPIAFAHQHNSRKRRPSYSQDERENNFLQFRDESEMEACNAALVLMSLSCSPRSPKSYLNKAQWNALGSSPGSSSASWSSGTSSPPLSDDGSTQPIHCANNNYNNNNRNRTTSLSTSDEGIVLDYGEETPRKRKAQIIYKCTWKGCNTIEMTVEKIESHVRNAHLGPKKPKQHKRDYEDYSDSEDDHEEEFYYTEIGGDEFESKAPSPPSPPTLSHRDMARPPHEDPEYQRQIVGNFRQGLLASLSQNSHKSHGPINIPTSPLAHHNYTWAAQPTPTTMSPVASHSPVSPVKHARWSPRPSTSSAPYPSPTYAHQIHNQIHNYSSNSNSSSNSNISNVNNNSNNHNNTNNQYNNHHNSIAIANNHQNSHHNQFNNNNNNNNGQLSQSAPNPTTFHLSPNIQHQTTTIVQNSSRLQQHQTTITPTTTSRIHSSSLNTGISYQNQHLSTGSLANTTTTALISSANRAPQSPNRRTRGENKKCRKVYGMDRKDQWCTQCKWKKACSRFGD